MGAAPNTARSMSEHWTGRADRFDGAASHVRHARDWKRVLEAALPTTRGHAIDLGRGTGACAINLAELGFRVKAVDGSEGMISHARREANSRGLVIDFVCKPMDDVELAAESVEVVTIRNVLWTLENPAAALRLAWHALQPDGKLFVSDGRWFLHRENDSATKFGAKLPFFNGLIELEARSLLAQEGFSDVSCWKHLFKEHPYGSAYDDSSQEIEFFVLTARKGRSL